MKIHQADLQIKLNHLPLSLRTVLVLGFVILPWLAQAQTPITNQNLYDTTTSMRDHYNERVALFEKQPVVTNKVMFLGNSITEMGNWAQLLGDTTVINRGIGGDITFEILKRLDDVTRRQPAKLFILIGINDISKDIPEKVIANNYRKIIEQVQAKSPVTQIYVQSLLPLNPEYPRFPQHYDKQVHVIKLNGLLKQVADATHSRFIDLFPLFLDAQKRLDTKYTGDGLRLNPAAYQVWVKYLKRIGCL